MKRSLLVSAVLTLGFEIAAYGEVKIVTDHNANEAATSAFKFKTVQSPAKTNAATNAKFAIVDGERDDNGGDLEKLHDGKLPTEEDQPAENFFFNAGTEGGRLSVDLGSVIEIKQIDTYSWHPNTRGPQVYKLYAADGKAEAFKEQPKKGTDPEKAGWKLIANVDTRAKSGEGGGQHGVSISDSDGVIGKYRYLLFDIVRTENDDPFGNTFYSEITVNGKEKQAAYITHSADGYCDISIDTSDAPELTDWAEHTLAPVLAEWYPKIASMLPSDGYNAPKAFSVAIRPGRGVAATGGTRVTANSNWLRKSNGEMDREAVGALLHEEVHVVQQYGRARRQNPDAPRPPGWLVEGIPDYIRWFLYEPQSHGADVTWIKSWIHRPARKTGGTQALRYDAGYRLSANFLNWATAKYKQNLVILLNAAIREGKYTEELWKEFSGHTVQELGEEWKAELQKQLGLEPADKESAPANEIKKVS